MACSRKGCDNILCSTYVEDFGYICRECIQEFKQFVYDKAIDENNLTKKQILNLLESFNSFNKGDNEKMSLDEFFG